MDWPGTERRQFHPLSEEQMDAIAERAAKKAIDLVYQEVGRSVIKKILWVVGIGTVALLTWLAKDGRIP
jgi:hypothetical protein